MKVTRGVALVALLLVSTATAASVASAATTPVTDASVSLLTKAGDRVYLGGDFGYVGPYTGSLARFDGTSGTPNGTFPAVDGPVMAMVSDGVGGWYIGGDFKAIGGQPHGPLAHIRSDGSLDPGFDPYPNAPVASLALADGKLYVGGYFTIMAGVSRNKIAAVNPITGAVDGNFDPNISGGSPYPPSAGVRPSPPLSPYGGGSCYAYNAVQRPLVPQGDGIYAILAVGKRVFLGGSFLWVGGRSRLSLAAVDSTTGELDPTFQPSNPDGAVFSLALAGTRLYIGGDFRQVNGLSRSRIAALNVDTGAVDEQFQAAADGRVNAIVPGDRLYVGGTFTHIAGSNQSRIAALNLGTGVPSGSLSGADFEVSSLALAGDRLYVAGGFERLGNAVRHYLGAINVKTGQVDAAFLPAVDEVPGVLATSANALVAGGVFDSVGGAFRPGIAAVVAATGALDRTFAPPLPRANVTQLLPAAGRLFAVLVTTRYPQKIVIAALDPATGAVDPAFKPPAMTGYPRITASGNKLYVLGPRIAGRRWTFFALDARTGALDKTFKPHDSGNNAVVFGKRLIVSGHFYTGERFKRRYGTIRRSIGVGAFDARTGKAIKRYGIKLPWPRYYGNSSQVFRDGNRVYIDGLKDRGLSAINPATGRLIAGFKGPRSSILTSDATRLYLSRGPSGSGPGAIRKTNGSWDRSFKVPTDGNVCAVQPSGANVFVGGAFTRIAGVFQPNFALIPRS
jgi:hypothetical protein